ncbi:MAG: CHASE2 domain-containing protein [Solirubrobacteraceae bacterium]
MSLIAVASLASGIGVAAYATGLLERSELQTIDARFSIRGARRPSPDVLFVRIDPATFQTLRHNFPFPRSWEAKVIDHLREAGARTIALDIDFSHPTEESQDIALFEALSRAHGKTVLAATEVGADGYTEVLGGAQNLRAAGARVGEDHFVVDTDGAVRRFARSHNGLGSFAVVAAEVFTGRRVQPSLFTHGTLPIDYAGPAESFDSISFAQVMKGDIPAGLARGRLVIVGASAPILQDLHPTPFSEVMPGPEVWANSTATLLEGVPLRDASGLVNVLLILLLGVTVPLGSLRVRRWRSMLDAGALAIVFTIATQLAFDNGRIITFIYPLLALALGTLGTLAVLYVGEAIERERTRDVFSRFVPGEVVDQVLASADDNLRLGGVERDCTVLFSDLRGFTSFSETQPAARVIEVVNHYLNEMTEAILDAGGTLIAYMGDGIMAVFGAPLEQEDHADRAVRAAGEMIGPRLDRFNGWLAEQGFGRSFEMGVGLNSGPVMAGNVGSEQRVEYTAIGDTTNTASRLEGMTKNSEAMLFISETTRQRMRSGRERLVRVGDVEIRGRIAKLEVWTIGPVAGLPDDREAETPLATAPEPSP